MWWILPATAQERVSSSKIAIQSFLNSSIALITLALVCAGFLVWHTLYGDVSSPERILALLIASIVLGLLSHRAAIAAVSNFRNIVASLIDVHRLKLQQAMGYKPATVAEEVSLFVELKNFFTEGGPRDGKRQLLVPKGGPEDSSQQTQ